MVANDMASAKQVVCCLAISNAGTQWVLCDCDIVYANILGTFTLFR